MFFLAVYLNAIDMLIAIWKTYFCRLRYLLEVISLSRCDLSEEFTHETSLLMIVCKSMCSAPL